MDPAASHYHTTLLSTDASTSTLYPSESPAPTVTRAMQTEQERCCCIFSCLCCCASTPQSRQTNRTFKYDPTTAFPIRMTHSVPTTSTNATVPIDALIQRVSEVLATTALAPVMNTILSYVAPSPIPGFILRLLQGLKIKVERDNYEVQITGELHKLSKQYVPLMTTIDLSSYLLQFQIPAALKAQDPYIETALPIYLMHQICHLFTQVAYFILPENYQVVQDSSSTARPSTYRWEPVVINTIKPTKIQLYLRIDNVPGRVRSPIPIQVIANDHTRTISLGRGLSVRESTDLGRSVREEKRRESRANPHQSLDSDGNAHLTSVDLIDASEDALWWYHPMDVITSTRVSGFIPNQPISDFENQLRSLTGLQAAQTYFSFLSLQSQLMWFKECDAIISTPSASSGPPANSAGFIALEKQGIALLNRIVLIIMDNHDRTALTIFASSTQDCPGTAWLAEATQFVTAAQSLVATLRSRWPSVANGRNIPCPLSAEMLRFITSKGFTHTPEADCPDLCTCDICGVRVSGWRSWHNPEHFHDLTRHNHASSI